jgi:hypothetical protein
MCRRTSGAQRAPNDAAILATRREQAQLFAMADRPRQPKKTHQQRLAAALRENLKRRKAQAKERSRSGESGPGASGTAPPNSGRSHDSAGIIEDK